MALYTKVTFFNCLECETEFLKADYKSEFHDCPECGAECESYMSELFEPHELPNDFEFVK